jgi:septal ring factor EnvC (AmiA/AmiB activator)
MDIQCGLIIAGVAISLVAMFLGYKIKADKKSVELTKKDEQHEKRIKKIEDKNGDEQHQIDEQKEEIKGLKTELAEVKKDKGELKDLVIKLQERIINCEKNGTKKRH